MDILSMYVALGWHLILSGLVRLFDLSPAFAILVVIFAPPAIAAIPFGFAISLAGYGEAFAAVAIAWTIYLTVALGS